MSNISTMTHRSWREVAGIDQPQAKRTFSPMGAHMKAAIILVVALMGGVGLGTFVYVSNSSSQAEAEQLAIMRAQKEAAEAAEAKDKKMIDDFGKALGN